MHVQNDTSIYKWQPRYRPNSRTRWPPWRSAGLLGSLAGTSCLESSNVARITSLGVISEGKLTLWIAFLCWFWLLAMADCTPLIKMSFPRFCTTLQCFGLVFVIFVVRDMSLDEVFLLFFVYNCFCWSDSSFLS